MSTNRQHRRLYKNYIIKRRFQMKWTSAILAASLGVFVILSMYIYFDEKHRTESTVVMAEKMGHDADTAALMAESTAEADRTTLWVLLGAGTGMIVFLAGLGINLTHKVAGPMYALGMFMEQVKAGDWRRPRGFRKTDEFLELGENFQTLVDALREKEEQELSALETIQSGSGLTGEHSAAMQALIDEKRKRLG